MWLLRPQILITILALLSFSRVAAAKENVLEDRAARIPANVYAYCTSLLGVPPENKPTSSQLSSVLECAEHVNPETGQAKPIPFEGEHNTRYGRGVR